MADLSETLRKFFGFDAPASGADQNAQQIMGLPSPWGGKRAPASTVGAGKMTMERPDLLQMKSELPARTSKRDLSQSEQKQDKKQEIIRAISLTYTPEQIQEMMTSLDSNPDIQAQRQGIEDMRGQIENYLSAPKQLDLSPLAQLTDTWTGSKFAQGYNKPQNLQEFAKDSFGLTDDLQKRREALTKALVEGVKMQKSGQETQKMLEALAVGGKVAVIPEGSHNAGIQSDRLVKSLEDNIRNDIDKKVLEPIQKRQEQFSQIDDSLRSNDYARVVETLAQFARGISGEKGVLTEKDVNRVIPANFHGDLAKFKAYLSSTPTAELPKEWTKPILAAIDQARGNARQVYSDYIRQKRMNYKASKTYGKYNVDVDAFFETAKDSLSPWGGYIEPSDKPAAKQNAGGIVSIDDFFKSKGAK